MIRKRPKLRGIVRPNLPGTLSTVQARWLFLVVAAIGSVGFNQKLLPQNEQELRWHSPLGGPFGIPLLLDKSVQLRVKANSGLPVIFRVLQGPAVIEEDRITPTGVGTIVVEARQDGNADYLPVFERRYFNYSSADPELVGRYSEGGCVLDLQTANGLAFLTGSENRVDIVDVSQPENPILLSSLETTAPVQDIQITENRLYLALGDQGLAVASIEDPRNPRTLGHYPSTCRMVVITEHHIHVVGEQCFEIVEIDAEGVMTMVSRFCAQVDGMVIRDLTVHKDRAFLAMGRTASPVELFNPCAEEVTRVNPSQYAPRAGGFLGLVDISAPEQPTAVSLVDGELTHFSTCDGFDASIEEAVKAMDPWGTVVDGNFVLVANGLRFFDIFELLDSGPKHTRDAVGVCPFFAWDLHESDQLHFIRINSSIGQLLRTRMGEWRLLDSFLVGALGARIVDNHLFRAAGEDGLEILKLTPRRLRYSDSLSLPDSIWIGESSVLLKTRTQLRDESLTFEVEGPAELEGNLLRLTDVGRVMIRYYFGENEQFLPATRTHWITITERKEQAITWTTPKRREIVPIGEPYQLSATATSGLPVSFSVESGPATIQGNILTVTDVGEITLRARQVGDETYSPVDSQRLINVRRDQTINWLTPTNGEIIWPNRPSTLLAEASSGLPVSFEVENGPASISGNSVIVNDIGMVTLVAHQAGDVAFFPVHERVVINVRKEQSIQWVAPSGNTDLALERPYQIEAVATSGLPVTYRMEAGPATLNGNLLTVHGPGRISMFAEQAGDVEFLPARARRVTNPAASVKFRPQISYDPDYSIDFVAVHGNILYATDQSLRVRDTTLRILDISHPESLKELGTYANGFRAGLQVVGNYAYGLDWTGTIEVVDVSNPTNPQFVSRISDPDFHAFGLRVESNRAYLMGAGAVRIFDIGNPATPFKVGAYQDSDESVFLNVVDGLAHRSLNRYEFGLVDLRNPSTPITLGGLHPGKFVQTQTADPFIYGLTAGTFRASHSDWILNVGPGKLVTLDASNPLELTHESGFSFWDPNDFRESENRVASLHVDANVAFLRFGDSGLCAVDLIAPKHPVMVGEVETTPGVSRHMALKENVLYVPLGAGGLQSFLIERGRALQDLSPITFSTAPVSEVPIILPTTGVSSSGLPVDYRVIEGAGHIEGNKLTTDRPGRVTIEVIQNGDELYEASSEQWSFSVVPQPALSLSRGDDGRLRLTVPTVTGATYELQRRRNVGDGEWEKLATTKGDGLPWVWTRTTEDSAQQFFRVTVESGIGDSP